MTTETSIKNLQLIVALDSLSYGLIYGFLSPYILKLGGTHVTSGILAVANLIAELLSSDVASLLTHIQGKRYALFFILNIALVSNLMLVLTESYWFTILVRFLFSLTNQSQNLCLELLLNKTEDENRKKELQTNYSILSGAGYILGPIISGYIFNVGFGYTGILAAILCFMNVRLLMEVKRDDQDANNEHVDVPILVKAVRKLGKTVHDLKKCDLKKNWDLLLLKYLFAGSIIIFFSKFSQLLMHNYKSSPTVIGYTSSYINSLVFLVTYYISLAKSNIQNYPIIFICKISFLSMAILMLLASFAPFYELYLFLIVPVIFLRTLVLTFWKDLFSSRNNESLPKLNNVASITAGLTIPLIFGAACNRLQHHAVILFSCIPMIVCAIILKYYSGKVDAATASDNNSKKDT